MCSQITHQWYPVRDTCGRPLVPSVLGPVNIDWKGVRLPNTYSTNWFKRPIVLKHRTKKVSYSRSTMTKTELLHFEVMQQIKKEKKSFRVFFVCVRPFLTIIIFPTGIPHQIRVSKNGIYVV